MQVFESFVPDDETIPASLSGASSIHRVSPIQGYCIRESFHRLSGAPSIHRVSPHSCLLFAPSIHRVSARLLFASSIHRVQVLHSAVQVHCSRVDASIVRVFYCSRLLLCVLKLITGSKTSINGKGF